MKKLLAVVLAIAMLISSSGITIASVVCTNGAKSKRATMCKMCQKSAKGVSTATKSCCKQSAKFFAVKTNFSKPAVSHINPLAVVAILQVVTTPLVSQDRAAQFASYTIPPDDAGQKCALISQFRI